MKEFLIGSLKWRIIEVPSTDPSLVVNNSPCYGTCHHHMNMIFLDEFLPYERKKQTLRHELTHAFISSYLLEQRETYTEEMLCEFVSIYSEGINKIVEDYFKEKENLERGVR